MNSRTQANGHDYDEHRMQHQAVTLREGITTTYDFLLYN